MVEALRLRSYQTECIDAVFKAWQEGMRRPAVVLPTGAGKTVVFSHLTDRFIKEHSNRVMILVHRDELADQAINKIRQVAPHLSVGKVKAQDNDIYADVMVCSVQTLASNKRRTQVSASEYDSGAVGLIITDECHHGSAPTYRKIYDAFPDALNVGFTATLARGDGAGLGDVWEDVVYTRSVLNMIGNGYLVDVKAKKVDVAGLDLAGVGKSRGDYQAGSLGEALQESGAMVHIAKAYQEHAGDRPGVVFTPTVETAHGAAESFQSLGIKTAVISGETPRDERLKIFEDYRTGRVQVLANCMVLTEGFDAPWASCAVIARPTQSQPLYVQMVGRVLRPWPGKKDALVLDVTGTGGMKLKTLVDLEPGAVQSMRDGETLEEAVDRENEEYKQEQRDAGKKGFFNKTGAKLSFKEHDMFAASDKHWLATQRGVLFISVGSGEVFLWASKEQPGMWDVCFAPKTGKWQRRRTGLPLDMAMAWGEADAEDFSEFSVSRSASWRKSKPSPAQVGLAERLRIEGAVSMRKGELSDALSVVFASRKLDRHL
jgi:superfamily II DNA or RNA helicase